jgi:two-component system, cell cycle response regulator DivK
VKKILIVEDVEFNRDLLMQILDEDYAVVTADDGAAGLPRRQPNDPISF